MLIRFLNGAALALGLLAGLLARFLARCYACAEYDAFDAPGWAGSCKWAGWTHLGNGCGHWSSR